ncbi:MAG: YlxM family DNA-binding protein [Bacillota bacterium]|nr:MAG: hypothetical protein DIU70_03470 [Bacillota bacterium]
MKDLERMALLLDFYGPLLTPRQQALMRAYYQEDLSLGEIAEAEQVSRQAVHDQIKRAEAALQEMENRLGLVAEHLRQQAILREACSHLEAARALVGEDAPAAAAIAAAEGLIRQLLLPADPPPDRG